MSTGEKIIPSCALLLCPRRQDNPMDGADLILWRSVGEPCLLVEGVDGALHVPWGIFPFSDEARLA